MPGIRTNAPNDIDKRDLLVMALRQGNDRVVDSLACDLFITHDGKVNWVEINAFQSYAPCKIGPGEQDGFGWLTGVIIYNGRRFVFG